MAYLKIIKGRLVAIFSSSVTSPQFYDSCYFAEISGLFPGCSSSSVSLHEAGYVRLDTTRTQARQVAFLAEVVLARPDLNTFLGDRWEEAVVRPSSVTEEARLARRIKIFCEENYCGKRDDWTVALHTTGPRAT